MVLVLKYLPGSYSFVLVKFEKRNTFRRLDFSFPLSPLIHDYSPDCEVHKS